MKTTMRLAPALVLAATTAGQAEVIDFLITLDGAQHDPVVDTAAAGTGTATLDTDTGLFDWSITFADLSSAQTAAHFHGAAEYCANAGVQIGLPLGSPIVGSQTVTAQQMSDIIAGLWYINVHTTSHPGGEIRGQVVPAPLADPIQDGIPASTTHVRLAGVADGLTAPNWGTAAPGIDGRLFVTDQDGTLWSIDLDTGAKHVVLDVSSSLVELGVFGPGSFDERGLLGVAFHPAYAKNGLLYTYTSEPATDPADFTLPPGVPANHHTVIREWQVVDPSLADPTVEPASTRVLLRIEQPQFNHNAGAIAFGPDDMLFIALGDGGGADDADGQLFIGEPIVGHGCLGNGQDLSTPLGSILRIDPSGTDSANGAYGIPADNPFAGATGGEVEETYAYGFRNPFRVSFDMASGAFYVADVGQNHLEEINVVTSGGNYGWRRKEGTFFFIPNGNAPGYAIDTPQAGAAGLVDPIAEYDHDEGIAIVGGFVYRGTKLPGLTGRYVFGEFALSFANDGRLFHLDETDAIRELALVAQDAVGLSVLGFGQDAAGEVYLMANATGTPSGTTGVIMKITNGIGDTDADGEVDVDDLLALLASWGPCDGCPADFDDDGDVDVDDLLALLANWS